MLQQRQEMHREREKESVLNARRTSNVTNLSSSAIKQNVDALSGEEKKRKKSK